MRHFSYILLATALCACSPLRSNVTETSADPSSLRAGTLRCQSSEDPAGVDEQQPRLSWKLAAKDDSYGKHQTAYRILVASTPASLDQDNGDLWDTGKVPSAETLHIAYGGHHLKASQSVFWKVHIWDENDDSSPWSRTASWTMGLLDSKDWADARWITDPELLRYQRHALGFRSHDATTDSAVKWLQLDLGRTYPIDEIHLRALRHEVNERLGFPLRFKVEAAAQEDFSDARILMDQTTSDFRNQWATRISVNGDGLAGRFVRITANKLRTTDGVICLAFSQIEVHSGGTNVAVGATVTAGDSVEEGRWSAASVVDGLGVPGANPHASTTLLLRRDFEVRPGLRRATMHVSGLGQYELLLNGVCVGDALLTPSWSDYGQTVYYDTHQLTGQLHSGANTVGLVLAGGMYNVAAGRYVKFTTPFRPPVAVGQIRLEYEDGRVETVATDDSWQVMPGPITFANVFGGEDYDAQLDPIGWAQAGFDASQWSAAAVTDGPGGQLRGAAQASPPIREHGVLKPLGVHEVRPGVTVYDLGQNVSLMLRLKARGPAGSKVKIIPAELLKSDGTVDRRSCGSHNVSWNYTLAGDPEGETWEPRFFYHGSRYLEVQRRAASEGGELPVLESIEGVIVHSDSPPAGEFSCSKDLFNRTRELIRWAQRSNLAHVLTDCPHRERLGWLEQYHLHGPSLRYEWDLDRLYVKTLRDMADSQLDSGLVPDIAPEYIVFSDGFRDSPEWGSAYALVPWQHFLWTGDLEPLREHYDGIERYVSYLGSKSTNHIVSHGLGDWYDIGPEPPGYAQLTPFALTATAFYYQDTRILAETARLLGKAEDARRFDDLAEQIRAAFNRELYDAEKGRYATGSQTAQAIPLVMGLVEESQRPRVVEALLADVRENGLTAGDIGHRYLLRALADAGRSDVIFELHSQSAKPGYGYILDKGATSLTEAWNARPESSQNHFMLGHITEWFYHDVAGIQPDPEGPGFKRIIIKPSIVGDLTWAKANYDSVRGPIVSAWDREGQDLRLDVEIPPNTSATVFVPGTEATVVYPADSSIDGQEGLEEGRSVFSISPGRYTFKSRLPEA